MKDWLVSNDPDHAIVNLKDVQCIEFTDQMLNALTPYAIRFSFRRYNHVNWGFMNELTCRQTFEEFKTLLKNA